MEAYFKKLYEQLEKKLSLVNPEISPVRGHREKAELVEEAIGTIKEFVTKHPFRSRTLEVMYFKHWAPAFFKLQILYTLLYNLELTRITVAEKEDMIKYLERKKKHLNRYLKKHKNLRLYYHLEQTDKDNTLFIHTPPTKKEEFLTTDNLYCKNSICLAKIIAYEEHLTLVTKELIARQEKPTLEPDIKNLREAVGAKYQWKPNKTQTAEIIYSFVKLKCISVNGHDADIKDVVAFFKDVFDITIENIYDVHLHNKRRKKDKAPYLNALKEAYLGSG